MTVKPERKASRSVELTDGRIDSMPNGKERGSKAYRKIKLRAGLILLAAAGIAAVVRAPATNEESAVQTTVKTYFYGLKCNDLGSFRKAFHPEAKAFFVGKNGEQLTPEDCRKSL